MLGSFVMLTFSRADAVQAVPRPLSILCCTSSDEGTATVTVIFVFPLELSTVSVTSFVFTPA